MNKKMLCENIMRNVRRSLNEAFAFESDPIGEDMLEVISKNENIANVVKGADEEDWKTLINKMKELAQNGRIADMKMPTKITNVEALAKAFLIKMDISNINLIKKLEDSEISGLVEYLNGDAGKEDGQKSIPAKPENPFAMESRKVEANECGGECKNGQCGHQTEGEKKNAEAIKESRLARRHRKKLNESRRPANHNRHLNEMRTDRDTVLQEIYQHLCDCQDLAEEIGEFGLMDKMEKMRSLVSSIRFNGRNGWDD